MAALELSDFEVEVLQNVIETYLHEATTEISNTDKYEYREELKKQRDTAKGILERLG